MKDRERQVAAVGVWLYDGVVPYSIEIIACPAEFAGSRFKENESTTDLTPDCMVLDESAPIPDTPDGFVYYCTVGGGEFETLESAKKWAGAQSWGPVTWK